MLTWLLREAPGLQNVISSRDYGFCVLSQRRFVFVWLAELLPAGRGGWHWLALWGSTRTPSCRLDQGLGGKTAKSALAWGHGSSPHLPGTGSSTGCLQMSLLLLWASCPACLPGSPQPPHPCPVRLLFTSPAENSLSLRFYLSGVCLTTNTSFKPFLSLNNLEFMQGCGSRTIEIQAECLVRLWLRQAVFTQQ